MRAAAVVGFLSLAGIVLCAGIPGGAQQEGVGLP